MGNRKIGTENRDGRPGIAGTDWKEEKEKREKDIAALGNFPTYDPEGNYCSYERYAESLG